MYDRAYHVVKNDGEDYTSPFSTFTEAKTCITKRKKSRYSYKFIGDFTSDIYHIYCSDLTTSVEYILAPPINYNEYISRIFTDQNVSNRRLVGCNEHSLSETLDMVSTLYNDKVFFFNGSSYHYIMFMSSQPCNIIKPWFYSLICC